MAASPAAFLDEPHNAGDVARTIRRRPPVPGRLIAANLGRQSSAPGPAEPANGAVTGVVEAERVGDLEAQACPVVCEPGSSRHVPRHQVWLLRRHQPVAPPVQQLAIDVDAKNSAHPDKLSQNAAPPPPREGRLFIVATEAEAERIRREHWRRLFDNIADRYDATRPGYPAEVLDEVCTAAGLRPGAQVLEIGCGTGQLTRQLAGRGYQLTAIDLGASMVAAAERNVADPQVRFEVCAFEEFAAAGPFDLIVSATAFHWVDPSIGLAKCAQLLRPGGWLALLSTGEVYAEPFRTQLREQWTRYSRQIVRASYQPVWVTLLRDTPLFGEPVELRHTSPLQLPAEAVIGLERTRATFLSYSEQDQADFTADLSELLEPRSPVELVRDTLLSMAQKAT
jgi:2-polyprenyl-3-methyl-5-hydroxy-6-metoxy-1,4-benzoquinol methylase